MTGVRMFGDLDDPQSDISKFIFKHKLRQFKAELNTMPRVYYRKG
jgi:Fe-S-cluster-containing dehydrogenase component